jgi:hypothetical protein
MTSSIAPASPNPMKIPFGMVTRFITITNTDTTNPLSFAVTYYGAARSTNQFILPKGQTLSLEWRITQLFVQGEGGTAAFSLAAGLTTIPPQNYYNLTGSAADGTNWPGIG